MATGYRFSEFRTGRAAFVGAWTSPEQKAARRSELLRMKRLPMTRWAVEFSPDFSHAATGDEVMRGLVGGGGFASTAGEEAHALSLPVGGWFPVSTYWDGEDADVVVRWAQKTSDWRKGSN